MARMREPKFKKCRRLGVNVCGHPKAMDRYNPREARDAKKLSEYGIQLLEKQKLRGYYEVLEKQFRRYVTRALRSKGTTGTVLVQSLETRLDNIVYRMGFASSIRQARQMVSHGHMLVNGKKVDIPSFNVSAGDVVSLREKSRNVEIYKETFEENNVIVPYVTKDAGNFSGTLVRIPEREEIPVIVEDRYVVEYYSRMQ